MLLAAFSPRAGGSVLTCRRGSLLVLGVTHVVGQERIVEALIVKHGAEVVVAVQTTLVRNVAASHRMMRPSIRVRVVLCFLSRLCVPNVVMACVRVQVQRGIVLVKRSNVRIVVGDIVVCVCVIHCIAEPGGWRGTKDACRSGVVCFDIRVPAAAVGLTVAKLGLSHKRGRRMLRMALRWLLQQRHEAGVVVEGIVGIYSKTRVVVMQVRLLQGQHRLLLVLSLLMGKW